MTGRAFAPAAIAVCAFTCLVGVPTAAAASSFVGEPVLTPQPALINEQLVTAQLEPSGLPKKSEIVNRIVANNLPEQTVKSETSTVDVRFLDYGGAPEVVGNSVLYPVGGPGQTSVATEATFSEPLPVALHAEYATPGEGAKGIDPADVPGTSGDMSITYTVTNTAVTKQEISYTDAAGNTTTKEEPVFAPFVGTLIATLPANVELTSAGSGIVNTTRDGNTSIQWNLMLYPPMGNYQQNMTFKVTGLSLGIPEVLMQVVPVTNGQDPAVGFSADLLSQSVAGSSKLADGLGQLNESTADLARGAAELAEGQQTAATGTAKAATGSGDITVGAAALTAGLTGLSAAIDEFAGPRGLPKAAASAGQIAEAVDELVAAIGTASDPPIPPSPPFPPKLTLVQAARVAEAATTALRALAVGAQTADQSARTQLLAAQSQLCAVPAAGCAELAAGIGLVTVARDANALVVAGLQALNTQVLAKITEGIIEVSTALKSSNSQSIYGALRELQAGLVAASKLMGTLAKGSQTAEQGASELTTASGTLTDGLDDLAAGSTKLAEGSAELANGADQLQEEGTARILDDVVESSSDPALADAYLTASSARAADATPYPPPKGAAGRIAYLFVLQTPEPKPSLTPAAIGIAVVAAGALAVVIVRRLRAPAS